MTWVLILYVYAGALADGDSVSLQAIEGFSSVGACQQVGKQAEALVKGSTKVLRFVCAPK